MGMDLSKHFIAHRFVYNPGLRMYVSETGLDTAFQGNLENAFRYAYNGIVGIQQCGRMGGPVFKDTIFNLIGQKPDYAIALIWGNGNIPSTDLLLAKGLKGLEGDAWKESNPEFKPFSMTGSGRIIVSGELCEQGLVLMGREGDLRPTTESFEKYMQKMPNLKG